MKKIHIALSTHNLKESIEEYSKRLSASPIIIIENEYALWKTETVNFSVRQDKSVKQGSLRHLGWEDSEATIFSQEIDVNGIIWENFNEQNQLQEIENLWH
ncbi:hypothetical protein VKI21_15285 [Cyanobacterium aponinum UTEX 3222]|uniref:hypothetical protein n=1 Tax=Cyanobacterium aponinum TaxID=379064 RepID=UPI002B4BF83F|nr:hypothetical protein [Cyanobacterium aponinum]WRL38127.1 hypothetical protein VKI22_16115 [Cyanobacterium aponinum UTEX 3221]WRL41394.1 hypothetical protein VKI21_15285 [Cyanobacterium aponinum UTEX 3222]